MKEAVSVFGIHAVQSLLIKQPERVLRLFIARDRQEQKIEALLQLAKQHHIPIESIERKALDRIAVGNHQGVLAYAQKAASYIMDDLPTILSSLTAPPFLLVLDGVQDPHNLGACLRSADAAGVHAVIAPKDKSVGLTPTVCKVASGAAETIPFVQVTNLARTLELLKENNIWVYGAAAEGTQNLYTADFKTAVALVLGGEGTGLRRLTREHCDALLNIPLQGSVSSLNVSVAAGVFLFEVVRQRRLF